MATGIFIVKKFPKIDYESCEKIPTSVTSDRKLIHFAEALYLSFHAWALAQCQTYCIRKNYTIERPISNKITTPLYM